MSGATTRQLTKVPAVTLGVVTVQPQQIQVWPRSVPT